MSEDGRSDPDPVVIEITADTGGFTDAIHRVQASLMFGFHPDLSTPAEREAREMFLRARAAGDDFQEQMEALTTQPGMTPEQIQRIKAAVLRMGEDGGEQA